MASSHKFFDSQNQIKAKVALLGDPAVGKTSLAIRWTKKTFSEVQDSTIGAAYFTQELSIKDSKIKLDIWDTAGQERYQALVPLYYRGAAAAIVVYDVTESATFNQAKFWVEKLRNQALNNKASKDVVIALVANKSDLLSASLVTTDAQAYAEKNNLLFFEASAKTGHNVNKLFSTLGEQVLNVSAQRMLQSTGIHLDNPNQQLMQKNGCCK